MVADASALVLGVRKSPRSFTLEIGGTVGSAELPALSQSLAEIETERYANVTIDLSSVVRIDISAARALAACVARTTARDLAMRTVPALPSLYLGAIASTIRNASAARRSLIEIHRAAILALDPRDRSGASAAILDPERRLRDTACAIVSSVVDLKTDPILLRAGGDEPDERAWRRIRRIAAAAGRADRELHACFLELSALAPHLRQAAKLALQALAESMAADDALYALADERIADASPAA